MEDLLNSVVDYVSKNGFEIIEKNENAFSFAFSIDDLKLAAKCELSSGFPYEIPSIYANDETYEIIKNIPHVSYDKCICSFDKTTPVPNPEEPEKMVLEVIKKAVENVKNGLARTNNQDYNDEFIAYWENYQNIHRVFCMHGCANKYTDSFWYKGKRIHHSMHFFKDRAEQGIIIDADFIFDGDYRFSHFINAFLDSKNKNRLLKFLNNNYSTSHLILFRNKVGSGTVIEGLLTPSYKQVDGFRNGKGNALMAITKEKDLFYEPVSIFNMTQERLYSRGGTGLLDRFKKVGVIGCGSFGSYLCESLMEYGISNFLLIDKEKIAPENIARHYCGANYITDSKAEALGKKLNEHNPNIEYEFFPENIHTFLNAHTEKLNEPDLLFVCIGDVATEKRIYDCVRDGKIQKPVIIIWGEPFCIACHAIVINKPQEIFSLIHNAEYHFIDNVVCKSSEFYKREAGCQSTYLPYSAYLVKRFIGDLLYKLFFGDLLNIDNYSYVWFGDLDKAIKNGIKIDEQFSESKSFSSITKKVS